MKRLKGKCKWCGKITSMKHKYFNYFRCRTCQLDGRKAIFDCAQKVAVKSPWMDIVNKLDK